MLGNAVCGKWNITYCVVPINYGCNTALTKNCKIQAVLILYPISTQVENSIQGSTMATCTLPVSDVLKAPDMKMNQPFPLDSNNPQSVLNLRLALKVKTLEILLLLWKNSWV